MPKFYKTPAKSVGFCTVRCHVVVPCFFFTGRFRQQAARRGRTACGCRFLRDLVRPLQNDRPQIGGAGQGIRQQRPYT